MADGKGTPRRLAVSGVGCFFSLAVGKAHITDFEIMAAKRLTSTFNHCLVISIVQLRATTRF